MRTLQRSSRNGMAIVTASVLLVSACHHRSAGSSASAGPQALATLMDSAGRQIGLASFRVTPAGVVIDVRATRLQPGAHGIHIHTVGKCDRPAFTTAGAHFNPGAMKHGMEATGGPHAGDLPNFVVAAGDTARYHATTDHVSLGDDAKTLLDADGSAIVIHAAADDNRTDPSGNSGARIACGVITRVTS
jgi:superoxide dismutase, Cu-Zn family